MADDQTRFDGTWAIDIGRSTVWDDAVEMHVPDEVGEEIITIRTADGVQDYEVLYGSHPTVRMGYSSRFDAPGWVPYLVRGITGVAEEEVPTAIESFKRRIKADQGERERRFEVGRVYALVRTVFVDERTHYRVHRFADGGAAQSIMLRRLAPDGESYVATVLNLNGLVDRVRTFVRS